MKVSFTGALFHWRGPSPFHFVGVPRADAARIHARARELTYGWGVIPCGVTIGATLYTTSLFPRDGSYVVPVKVAVRRAEKLQLGDLVTMTLDLGGA